MCGIAGFSLSPDAAFDRSALARVLLAGIAERGQDATGWAWRTTTGPIAVEKASLRLAKLMERVELPDDAAEAIMHVREFTKGIPGINDNNHPIRWGQVVGVHNGHLTNDDQLFARFQQQRSTASITVDSEAIMMLTDVLDDAGEALERVHGSAAVALLRDDEPGLLTLARRTRRPIVIGRARGVLLFASTREPLELIARATRTRLRYEELRDGTLLEVRAGEETDRRRFAVDYNHAGRKLVAYPHLPEKPALLRLALSAFAA